MEIEKIVSGEGINSTFVSGGVMRDAIRDISGYIDTVLDFGTSTLGCLSVTNSQLGVQQISYSASGYHGLSLNAGRVVPTASDNRVRTLSSRLWRRVA